MRASEGFSLLETLIALMLSTLVIVSSVRLLPLFVSQNQRLLQENQFRQELQHLLLVMEKSIRRAGFCQGNCPGNPVIIDRQATCLLVRWDDDGNGRWDDDEIFGWRLRRQSLETQRGQPHCDGQGWERTTDPSWFRVMAFSVERKGHIVKLMVSAALANSPQRVVTLESWVRGENL